MQVYSLVKNQDIIFSSFHHHHPLTAAWESLDRVKQYIHYIHLLIPPISFYVPLVLTSRLLMSNPEIKREDDNLFDMLNLSPPTFQVTNNVTSPSSMASKDYGDPSQDDSPVFSVVPSYCNGWRMPSLQNNADVNLTNPDLAASSLFTSLATQNIDSQNLLSPHNFPGYQNNRSFDSHSTHSLYSEASLNPGSPFHDAVSHFSDAYSNAELQQQSDLGSGFIDPAPRQVDTFNEEILLGQSISSTNLSRISYSDYSSTQEHTQPQGNLMGNQYTRPIIQEPMPQNGYNLSTYGNHMDRLTERNLINYNENVQNAMENREITISIHQAPDIVAAKTPSLFSNSSHNSSVNNYPRQTNNQTQVPARPGSSSPHLPSGSNEAVSPGSYSDYESKSYLRPDEIHSIRRGRQKAHSLKVHSRLRSRSALNASGYEDYSGEDSDDGQEDGSNNVSSREKMLELASTLQTSKRVQKHPSLYACHLCEKRFTRPYNLKSHLRTHTDERPFICNVCGKAFARQHDRKRHEELHSGEKKFQCKGLLKNGTPYGCGRKFARADALRRHFQTESGKECIRQLIEEDEAERRAGKASSGIQLPGGEFLSAQAISSQFLNLPSVSILPPE